MANKSIYTRMRLVLEDFANNALDDPNWAKIEKNAREWKEHEKQLLAMFRRGLITWEECIIAVTYTAMSRVHFSFLPYHEEWEQLKGFEAKLAFAQKITAGWQPENIKITVHLNDAVPLGEGLEVKTEPRRDVAGNYVCAGCGLATALTEVDGRLLCDVCRP